MNIEKHIYDLLFRYECVIIPSFGGLITSHCPAMVQNDEHLFYPPSKFLAFNKNLNKQDGLLANYLSSKEKISYTEAISKIDQFVRSIQNKLTKGEKVSLVHIGTFSIDKEKNILFTPEEHTNYSTASFGLPTFYASPIKREETEYAEKRSSNALAKRLFPGRVKSYHLAFAASMVLFASVWLPVTNTPEQRHIDYSSLNTFGPIQKPVTAEALFTAYNPFAKEEDKKDSASKLAVHVAEQNITPIPSTTPINETETKPTSFSAEAPQESTEIKTPQPKPSEEVILSQSGKRYYIIAGVFAQKTNAEKMVNQLNADGYYNALIVDKNKKGLYRVAFDSFTQEGLAEDILKEIKTTKKRSAWMLEK